MRNTAMILGSALAVAACTAGTTTASDPRPLSRGESRALATLEGRIPEPRVPCVEKRDLGDAETLPDGNILFRGRTSAMVYVNTPPAGCPGLGSGRSIRTRSTSTRLCSGDIIEVFDPVANFGYGGCGLGEFTPYRRPG